MSAEFDRYAAEYSKLSTHPLRDAMGTSFLHERKWILLQNFYRKAGLSARNQRWLDVGCGKGELLALGKPSFSSVAGCDLSEGMLEDCGGLDVRAQDSPETLPFADREFDLETAVCVYHHLTLEQRPAVTREVVRTLKPGGVFAIIEHNPFNPITQFLVSRIPIDANAILLTPGTTKKLMREAGLEIVHSEYFLYLPEGLYRKLAPLESAMSWFPMGGQYVVIGRKPA
ncbi:MAG TPA: methyltransferase domain-containing protein [Bryobacteraceae bacterium]|nr:methyltransferase domain-containing protein [Bryobacteraceae bacterium]